LLINGIAFVEFISSHYLNIFFQRMVIKRGISGEKLHYPWF